MTNVTEYKKTENFEINKKKHENYSEGVKSKQKRKNKIEQIGENIKFVDFE